MAERTLAASRSILVTLLIAAGALAAALPSLLGEPSAEHPALRGLGAVLIALMAALLLAARWGSRGPLAPKAHLLELAKIFAVVTALQLPALFAGMTTSEVESLSGLAQSEMGWKRPLSAWTLGLWLLGATYVVSRLKSSVREERLANPVLVALSVLVFLALFCLSGWLLLLVPSPAGLEWLVKRALILTLLTICCAVFASGARAGRGLDSRMWLLVSGFVSSGAVLAFSAHNYLQPGLSDIDRILGTTGDAKGTRFAASLQDRPDLYGLFSLEYASATPRLEVVRPIGTSPERMIEKIASTWFGSARLEPPPDFGRISNWARVAPLDERFEVRFRLDWWPWFELPSGLRFDDVPYGWAVAPNGGFVVTSTYEPDFVIGSTSGSVQSYGGTAAVRLWSRWAGSATLLEGLAMTPHILELQEGSLRLLVFGQSSPEGQLSSGEGIACSVALGPPQIGTTTCDLKKMKCEPWVIRKQIRGNSVQPGARFLVGGMGEWALLDPRTLETVAALPKCDACSDHSDFVHLLRNGRIVRLSLLGRMPNWESRVAAYDINGQEMAVTSLGNLRQVRFAGELDDGTIAILWRVNYAYSVLTEPAFGWTLEAWDPRTGVRRRLADDLGTFPCSENDSSMIFVDRNGRMVVPAVDGVRVLAQLGYPLPVN